MTCEPHVRDDPGALQQRHVDRLAGKQPVHVQVLGVPFRLLVARDAAVASADQSRRWAEDVAKRDRSGRAGHRFVVVNPDQIVRVGPRVLVGHVAIRAVLARVAQQQQASSRLLRIVAISDDQYTMPIEDAFGRRHHQDTLFPLRGLLGPAETAAHRPAAVEHVFDGSQLFVSQSRVWIPGLDPVQSQVGVVPSSCVIPGSSAGECPASNASR